MYTGDSSQTFSKTFSSNTNSLLTKKKKCIIWNHKLLELIPLLSNHHFHILWVPLNHKNKTTFGKQSLGFHRKQQQKKPFTYSIPELFKYALKHFCYSLRKVNAFVSTTSRKNSNIKSFASIKKKLFSKALNKFSKYVCGPDTWFCSKNSLTIKIKMDFKIFFDIWNTDSELDNIKLVFHG